FSTVTFLSRSDDTDTVASATSPTSRPPTDTTGGSATTSRTISPLTVIRHSGSGSPPTRTGTSRTTATSGPTGCVPVGVTVTVNSAGLAGSTGRIDAVKPGDSHSAVRHSSGTRGTMMNDAGAGG